MAGTVQEELQLKKTLAVNNVEMALSEEVKNEKMITQPQVLMDVVAHAKLSMDGSVLTTHQILPQIASQSVEMV